MTACVVINCRRNRVYLLNAHVDACNVPSNMIMCFVLQSYSKNPKGNWKNKDAAIFLITSLAAKGQTQKVPIIPAPYCQVEVLS